MSLAFSDAWKRGVRIALVAVLSIVLASWVVAPTAASASDTSGTGGSQFHPLQVRLLDTRNGPSGSGAPLAPNEIRKLQVTGVSGIPATGVSAIALTVTSWSALAAGSVSMGPDGVSPSVSYLSYEKGKTDSNTAIIEPGSNGIIDITSSAYTNILVDVQGYFSVAADGTAGGYQPITPTRIGDTRTANGPTLGQHVTNGTTVKFPVGSAVPATAQSVFADIVVVDPEDSGYVVAGGATNVSLNFGRSRTAIGTTVPIVDGALPIRLGAGTSADIVVDIEGYFDATNGYTQFHATSLPQSGFPSQMSQTIAPNSTTVFRVAGVGDIPSPGFGTTAVMATATVSATAGTSGHVLAWKRGEDEPGTTNLDYSTADRLASNAILLEPDEDGYVTVANHGNSTITMRISPQGYFTDPDPADEDFEGTVVSETDLPDSLDRDDLYTVDPSQNMFVNSTLPEDDGSPIRSLDRSDPDSMRVGSTDDTDIDNTTTGDPNDPTVDTSVLLPTPAAKVPSGYRIWGGSGEPSEDHYRTGQLIAYTYHCPHGSSHCIIDNEIKFDMRITLNGNDSKKWHFGTTKVARVHGSTPYSGQYGYSCGVNVKRQADHTCGHGATRSGQSGKLNMTGTESKDTYYTFERRSTFGVNYAMLSIAVRFGKGRTENLVKLRGWDVCVTRSLSEFCLDTGNGS